MIKKRYNVVVSFIFNNEKDQKEWIEFCKCNGRTVLYHGVHDRPITQKVITQEVFE